MSFENIAIIPCGTLSPKLNHLLTEWFLDSAHLYFTTPGLHEKPKELEKQLVKRTQKTRQKTDNILLVYGGEVLLRQRKRACQDH